MERRFQSYRGTWAWLAQRLSAICLVFLIPVKVYTGWVMVGKKLPFPGWLGPSARIHISAALDILLLLFFLVHTFYGLRVILIDVGLLRENTFFWRTMAAAGALFGFTVWVVYLQPR